MARQADRYRVELEVETGSRERAVQPSDDEVVAARGEGPFHIALLGDFSGRGSRGVVEHGRALLSRPVLRVDRDSVDDAIARFSPELRLTLGGTPLDLRFAELEDFHPDRLYDRVPQFQALRAAVDLMRTIPGLPADAPRETIGAPAGAPSKGGGNVLDEILGEAPAPPGGAAALPDERPASAPARSDLDGFVRRVVDRHRVSDQDALRGAMATRVDRIIAEEMRTLLHDPGFQALESIWRGVDFLVRRLETDENLRVYLIDVSREELLADLAPGAGDEGGAVARLLVERSLGTPGAAPWALIVGNYTFRSDPEDAALLGRLANVARAAGAPFVAAAAPGVVGAPSFTGTPDPDDWNRESAPAWNAVRRGADATWVGLVAPRFLVRAPYGRESDECERFPFEELDSSVGTPEHEHYLWGNPAIVCAQLLGEAYAESGWNLRPRRDVAGLPLHVYPTPDGPAATPCAEGVLTERALERMLERGVMPLASVKDSDAIRLVRIQSLAEPIAPLSGWWQ